MARKPLLVVGGGSWLIRTVYGVLGDGAQAAPAFDRLPSAQSQLCTGLSGSGISALAQRAIELSKSNRNITDTIGLDFCLFKEDEINSIS